MDFGVEHRSERGATSVRMRNFIFFREDILRSRIVEEYEMAVLAGADAKIRRDRPILLVEAEDAHHPDATSDFFRWASERGYRGWFFKKGRAVPVEDFRLAEHQGCKTIGRGDLFRRYNLNCIDNILFVPNAGRHNR